MIGTTLAQAISVIMLPILQKLYSPADFGVLNLFTSLSTLFVAFSTLKLEYAIVLPKQDKDAKNLLYVTSMVVMIGSVLTGAILLLFSNELLPGVNDKEQKLLLFLIPITVLCTGLYESLSFWFNRMENYKAIAAGKMVQNSSTETYRLIHYLSFGSSGGLIAGKSAGYLIGFLFLFSRFLKAGSHSFTQRISIPEIIKKYRHFPLFTMPTVFVSSFSSYVFAFLFIEYFGNTATGMISVAHQYVSLPLGIIAGSFSQVFYKRISVIDNNRELLQLYSQFSLRLIAISLMLIVLITLLPDSIPSLLFGPSWDGLMPFVRLTVIWQGVAFVSSSLSFIYTKLMKQRTMLFFALLQLAFIYFSLSLSNDFFKNPYDTFLIYTIAQCIYYGLTILAAFYFIKTINFSKLNAQE